MKKEKKIICVRCPRGCEVQTSIDGAEIFEIKGNVCRLGEDYVKDEIKNPKRIVTTTVKIKNSASVLLPVWTEKPVPKDKIFEIMKILNTIEVQPPVKSDDIIVENILNTGVNVIASSNVNS